MRKTKEQNGITLIALIITIIVLLILAVVAISAVQDDGIINYAINSRETYEVAQGKENITLQNYLDKIKENVPTNSSGESTKNPNEITFYITMGMNGYTHTLKAEKGMSLKSWVNSDYNKIKQWRVQNKQGIEYFVIGSADGEYLMTSDGNYANAELSIEDETEYRFIRGEDW